MGPGGIAYVADVVSKNDSTIRKITQTSEVSTLAGTPGTLAPGDRLTNLSGLAVDASSNVFASDYTSIRKITPQGAVSVFAGSKRSVVPGTDMVFWRVDATDGTGTAASFSDPSAVARDSFGNLFVTESRGCVIRKVSPSAQVTTVASLYDGFTGIPGSTDGTGASARFRNPHGIAVDSAGNLFIADSGNHTIRKMSPAGVVTTIGGLPGFAGSAEGSGDRALFNQPFGIAVDASGTLYVTDTLNHRIVKGVAPLLPEIVVADSAGNHLTSGSPALDFGNVKPSTTSPAKILTVSNNGKTPLNIAGIELIGEHSANFNFDRSGLPDSIPPNGSGTIRITFRPVGLGLHSPRLRISSDDPDRSSAEILLNGMGNNPPVFSGYTVSSPPVTPVVISLTKLLSQASDPDGDALSVTSLAWPAASGGPLRLESGTIVFYPSSPYFDGTRTFLATITDARGGSVTGNVSVTWQSSTSNGAGSMATNPPKLTLLKDGKVNVSFHGIPGRSYVIQRSANLANWVNLATLTANATGVIQHIDNAPLQPNGYYRLAIP